MTISAIDQSQRTAAQITGLAYLITLATVIYVNFGVHNRLISENNAKTVRNIQVHETLFRIGIVGDLVYCAGVVVLLTALYVILRSVSPGLALLATFGRLIFVLMWLAVALSFSDILRLLDGVSFAPARAEDPVRLFRTPEHERILISEDQEVQGSRYYSNAPRKRRAICPYGTSLWHVA